MEKNTHSLISLYYDNFNSTPQIWHTHFPAFAADLEEKLARKKGRNKVVFLQYLHSFLKNFRPELPVSASRAKINTRKKSQNRCLGTLSRAGASEFTSSLSWIRSQLELENDRRPPSRRLQLGKPRPASYGFLHSHPGGRHLKWEFRSTLKVGVSANRRTVSNAS